LTALAHWCRRELLGSIIIRRGKPDKILLDFVTGQAADAAGQPVARLLADIKVTRSRGDGT